MNKASNHKQIVLQNPFHPLDLSAHDLLTVYKKFDMSREANRNPKHQLPIEVIAQLISSLKGCKPSYVQKCMTQALIKQTISWNDFLAFLDQESEVREKILDWLIHQKAIIKYKFVGEYPFRHKVYKYYDQITSINCLKLGSDELMIVIIDYRKVILIDLTQNKFEQVDEFTQKNESQKDRKTKHIQAPNNQSRNESHLIETKNIKASQKPFLPNTSKIGDSKKVRIFHRHGNKSMGKMDHTSIQVRNLNISDQMIDQQAYFKRQRKNIHSLFNLFNELPLQKSIKVAEEATQKIRDRAINTNDIISIKEKYGKYIMEKKHELRETEVIQTKPLQKARKKLASLYQEKSKLTYNPYKQYKSIKANEHHDFSSGSGKKLGFDRKQKEYLLQQSHQIYNDQLKCLGMIFYNLQICLLKVVREYNKIILEEQDSMKIIQQKDHKKNQIVEAIEFYHHRVTNKWFFLVLFRSQYKNQNKSLNQSCIRGYEIFLIQHKRRMDYNYKFNKIQEFTIDLGKCSMVSLVSQPQYGIHIISNSGKYVCLKEDYPENEPIYFKKQYEEKFKNSSVSLSCLEVSSYLNKVLLGTIKGILIIFDQLSRQYKMKKVSNSPILQIKIIGEHGYVFCSNQKIIIYDILRSQQIQILSVKNEEKLHEKCKKFQFFNEKFITYGTNIRIFQQYIDESLRHEKRKMQNMYTWRLQKLKKTFDKKIKVPELRDEKNNVQINISSQNFFIILTQIHEVIFLEKNTQQIKFTIILDINFDAKVMKMILSPDEKLLAILLFNQNIYVFNVYTQELFMNVKPTAFQKYTTISFLDKKNEYSMAAGGESGDIYLIPYPSVPQKPFKLLQYHKKSIVVTVVKNQYLISTAEDNTIAVWQLPFNVLRHQIKSMTNIQFISEHIGFYLDHICFLKGINGSIIEVNMHEGNIKNNLKEFKNWVVCSTDPFMGIIIGVNKEGEITVLERNTDKDVWKLKTKLKINCKAEVIGIGIVPCQKAIFFTQNDFCVWSYSSEKVGKNKSFLRRP